MRVVLVVAAAENDVIGAAGTIPWRIPSDLRRFRALTMGRPAVMGRRTYHSLPRALDGRTMIVVSRTLQAADGVLIAGDLGEALRLAVRAAAPLAARGIAIIGGARIYEGALPYVTTIELTRVHAAPPGDTHFAVPPGFAETARVAHPAGPRDDHATTYITLERVAPARPLPSAAGAPY